MESCDLFPHRRIVQIWGWCSACAEGEHEPNIHTLLMGGFPGWDKGFLIVNLEQMHSKTQILSWGVCNLKSTDGRCEEGTVCAGTWCRRWTLELNPTFLTRHHSPLPALLPAGPVFPPDAEMGYGLDRLPELLLAQALRVFVKLNVK